MKVLFSLMFLSGAAVAADPDLLSCRKLPDGPVRLACYNAIPAGEAAVAAPATATMVPAAPAAMKSSTPEADVVTSFEGMFDGWVAGQNIRLANGQIWKVIDGSEYAAELRNPKVTIQRGLLGAVFLDIEGAHRSPRVRRVK